MRFTCNNTLRLQRKTCYLISIFLLNITAPLCVQIECSKVVTRKVKTVLRLTAELKHLHPLSLPLRHLKQHTNEQRMQGFYEALGSLGIK